MKKHEIEAIEKMAQRWEKDCTSMWEASAELQSFLSSLKPDEDEWQPMETAPKDGTHILVVWACDRPSFGHCGNPPVPQWWEAVVHWFDTGTEAGFWLSSGGDSDAVELATHWRPLPPAPETSKGVLP